MRILKRWETFKSFSVQFSQPHKRGKIWRYLFPILLILIIFPLKLLMQYYAIEGAPYLLLTFIVILSAWYGGLGPGIFGTLIAGILGNLLFLTPQLSISIESMISTFIFIIQGIIISMISEAKRYADVQKDEFISFASHELKNPLAVIKGYLDLLTKLDLSDKNTPKKSREYIATAKNYVDKATNLINELLDITKIEQGKITLNKEVFSINKLVQELVRDQQLLSNTHKIKCIGKSNRKIYGDRTRINQIITNMITNAIKYSPGEKSIQLSIINKKNSVIISVKDFGIGLNEEELQKVFDRFYRVSNTQVQGLGLGLFISKKIADLHGGTIIVKSIYGKGSTFSLKLPSLSS